MSTSLRNLTSDNVEVSFNLEEVHSILKSQVLEFEDVFGLDNDDLDHSWTSELRFKEEDYEEDPKKLVIQFKKIIGLEEV